MSFSQSCLVKENKKRKIIMLLAGWINQFIPVVAPGSGHWSTNSSTSETEAKGIS